MMIESEEVFTGEICYNGLSFILASKVSKEKISSRPLIDLEITQIA